MNFYTKLLHVLILKFIKLLSFFLVWKLIQKIPSRCALPTKKTTTDSNSTLAYFPKNVVRSDGEKCLDFQTLGAPSLIIFIISLGLFCHCPIGWQTCSCQWFSNPETVTKSLGIKLWPYILIYGYISFHKKVSRGS